MTSAPHRIGVGSPPAPGIAPLLGQILSTRLTPLEGRAPEASPRHVRAHFRMLEGERRRVQFAVLASGDFDRALEEQLEALDMDGVVIRDPSASEIAALDDFHLAPEWVRWVMPCPASVPDWIAGLPGSDSRNQMKRKLRAGLSVGVETGPLTLMDYQRWYSQLYVPEILSKSGAIPAWPDVSGLSQRLGVTLPERADETVIPGFLRIFMYDGEQRLLGGSLVSIDERERTLRVRAAAYEAGARAGKELAVRAVAAMIEAASARGFSYLSYGDDPNLYGVDVTVGLARFKASVGMQPIPSDQGGFQLLKLFERGRRCLAAEEATDVYSGLLCFGIPPGHARVGAWRRLSVLIKAPLDYRHKIERTQADAAGLQIASDPSAPLVRLPKGMRHARFDHPG